ncbi:MAG: hypothetical protein KDA28_12220, partial [Phycisphaerales bacterium]|nr:hypothetical protein [Phycisphaerales bacterium]
MDSAYTVDRLGTAAATIYAELTSQLVSMRATRTGELPPGTFTRKSKSGRDYWYIQYAEAGQKRQVYVGPDDDDTRATMRRLQDGWTDLHADRVATARLVSMLQSAGVHSVDGATARVLEVLEAQGVFDVGVVLVGSLAFLAYEGMLGVSWSSSYRTADIDLASPGRIEVAVPASLPDVLAKTGLPFAAIPALDPRSPSTAFKVRRQQL